MATTPVGPADDTGLVENCVLTQVKSDGPHGTTPLPNWPRVFNPHAHTVPSACSAIVCELPPSICTAVLLVGNNTGVNGAVAVVVPSPSWPRELSPTAHTAPSSDTANASDPEIPMLPIVLAGSARAVGVRPQPNPKAHTVPVASRARVRRPCAAIATTGNGIATATGESRVVCVPSPNSPTTLRPHVQSVPSAVRAALWLSPAARATTSLTLGIN